MAHGQMNMGPASSTGTWRTARRTWSSKQHRRRWEAHSDLCISRCLVRASQSDNEVESKAGERVVKEMNHQVSAVAISGVGVWC